MTTISAWILAFRLRTLPLSLASILMGSFLAQSQKMFRWDIFIWACMTTIFLQILSNLANDYGDFVNGADTHERKGEKRMVQAGLISPQAMKKGIIITAFLSLISGLNLLYISVNSWEVFWFFLGLGVLCIIAAITYTMGKKPYGYVGLGDISVFLFFGIVGVSGTYFLFTKQFHASILLPAAACGLLATGVLNLNNIRDIETDKLANKKTIPLRLGKNKAVIYHTILLIMSVLCSSFYVILHFQSYFQWLFLCTLPFLYKNWNAVNTIQNSRLLDPYLKQLALTTLLFVILFGIGFLI
jgi:1,4-dihydroxy-2-naphthoate octaprenyltransferase